MKGISVGTTVQKRHPALLMTGRLVVQITVRGCGCSFRRNSRDEN
jgi:hypothetical protein